MSKLKSNCPVFSIIISTYNRSSFLIKAIESVSRQNYFDYEIIISDDASFDDTESVVRNINNPKIKYIRNKRNLGISATRNAAIRLAKGKYILFMDDDSELGDDFLNILSNLVRDERVNGVCPRILDLKTKEPFLPMFSCLRERCLGYFDFNYFIGLAHMISAEAIDKNSYLDENFGVGAKYHSSEESDYFFRLKKTGEKILYYPDLVVYHPQAKGQSSEKVFNYSYGIAAMLIKQIFTDIRHSYFYLLIIARRLIVSFLRSLQCILFPRSIEEKNRIYRYKHFFKGTVKGIFSYLASK